jgi:hypothetical protein
MRSDKREPASLVDLGYIFHDPGIGCMTPAAIRTDRLLMHVRMTTDAGSSGIGKDQSRMALPAIYYGVLTR